MPTAPFGSWKSPITSDLITQSTIGIGSVSIDGTDVFWLEQRPKEGGRNVLVMRDAAGKVTEVTPAPFNVRTRAHEYGGGSYLVKNRVVYFVNFADQRIYRQEIGKEPQAITKEEKVHYADMILDEKRNRLVCVQEDHNTEGQEAITTISSVSLKDGSVEMLIAGNDFYAAPRISPNGMFMSWMSWNHPNMPWDESFVWCGNLASDGSLSNMRNIAGGPGEAVFQPHWSPDSELFYISDRSGWWNIYKHTDYEGEFEIAARQNDFGYPLWNFGMTTYDFVSATELVCSYSDEGTWRLATVDTTKGDFKNFDLPYTDIQSVKAGNGKAYFRASGPAHPAAIVELDLKTGQTTILKQSMDLALDTGYLSQPETIKFPTSGGKDAYAFFYPPKNKDYEGAANELPPVIVKSHGGPTAASTTALSLGIQYWTSRGFGVVDVNYGGSTGYGRDYRSRLYSSWGIVDVEDCINAAKYLVEQKRVDGNKMAITGGSAGGYTTLCALTFHKTFKAGASHFGVSDLEALATDTHKFEARYLDRLVGPYPIAAEIYKQRSPIQHVDQLNSPMIFLQGLEDKVVPPNQSEMMVNALKKKGVPVAYVTFEGEQHGFRKAENIKRALDAELYFYSRIFGFDLADKVEPVEIENLTASARS
jgi:dipeptidyl aminopeptidase/acylaminoacyl peptidase